MALPPFATDDKLADWLGAPVDPVRAAALLAAASTLVRTETGSAWVDTDGDPVWDAEGADDKLVLLGEQFTAVAVASAGRAYLNRDGVTQETTGPFSRSFGGEAAQGVYLTDTEKAALGKAVRAYRGAPSPGVWTLSTTRGPLDTLSVIPCVNVDGSWAEPFVALEEPTF